MGIRKTNYLIVKKCIFLIEIKGLDALIEKGHKFDSINHVKQPMLTERFDNNTLWLVNAATQRGRLHHLSKM